MEEGPPPWERADQSEGAVAEPGARRFRRFPQLLRGELGSVGVLRWPPPPLSRLGWAWLRAAGPAGRACQRWGCRAGPGRGCFGGRCRRLRFSKELEGFEEPEGAWKGLAAAAEVLGTSLSPRSVPHRGDLKEDPFASPHGVPAQHVR